jgi:lipopolysaccharide transport system permease protein
MTIQNLSETNESWTKIIRPKRSIFDLRLGALWHARDLILLFVRRDFVSVYKQTILGPLWYLIQPLLTTITFTVIFGNIAKLPTDGLPQFIFYMSGTVIWSYFASCLTKTSDTFISNANLFGKVYFPRLAVPVSILISNLIAFSIQFGFFLIFMGYFLVVGSSLHPNAWILLMPVLLLIKAGLGLGIIVPSRDAWTLSDGWVKILGMSKKERQVLGERARRHIQQNFSIEQIALRYEILYMQVVSERNYPSTGE